MLQLPEEAVGGPLRRDRVMRRTRWESPTPIQSGVKRVSQRQLQPRHPPGGREGLSVRTRAQHMTASGTTARRRGGGYSSHSSSLSFSSLCTGHRTLRPHTSNTATDGRPVKTKHGANHLRPVSPFPSFFLLSPFLSLSLLTSSPPLPNPLSLPNPPLSLLNPPTSLTNPPSHRPYEPVHNKDTTHATNRT